jgi:hypothetical protein
MVATTTAAAVGISNEATRGKRIEEREQTRFGVERGN